MKTEYLTIPKLKLARIISEASQRCQKQQYVGELKEKKRKKRKEKDI